MVFGFLEDCEKSCCVLKAFTTLNKVWIKAKSPILGKI